MTEYKNAVTPETKPATVLCEGTHASVAAEGGEGDVCIAGKTEDGDNINVEKSDSDRKKSTNSSVEDVVASLRKRSEPKANEGDVDSPSKSATHAKIAIRDTAGDAIGMLDTKLAARLVKAKENAQKNIEANLEESMTMDDKAKMFVVRTLQIVILIDFMGPILSVSMGPNIYVPRPAFAPFTDKEKDAGYGVFVQEATDFPLGGVAGAMQVGPNLPTLATGLGQLSAPWFMSRFGRRNSLFIFTFGASGFYLLAAQGQYWGMYIIVIQYAYWAFRVAVGYLSCVSLVLNSFIGEWYQHDKKKLAEMVTAPIAPIFAAVAIGPSVGNAILTTGTASNPTSLFATVYGAAILDFIAGIVCMKYVPKDPSTIGNSGAKEKLEKYKDERVRAGEGFEKKAKTMGVDGYTSPEKAGKFDLEEDSRYEKVDKEDLPWTPSAPKDPNEFKKWVYLIWFARWLDGIGGNTFGWVMLVGFSKWKASVSTINNTITLFSLIGLVAMPLSVAMSKQLGLAWPCILCNAIAGTLCFIMSTMVNEPQGSFLPLFFLAQVFSMTAGMLSPVQQAMLFPNDKRDIWVSRQQAMQTLIRGAAGIPLMVLVLNSEFETSIGLPGGIKEGTFFICCGVITLSSCIPYIILTKRFPYTAPPKPTTEDEKSAQEEFDKTGDITWFSARQLRDLRRKCVAEGKKMPVQGFGTFEEDMCNLPRIMKQSREDMLFHIEVAIPEIVKGMKENPEKYQKVWERWLKDSLWTDQDAEDMTKWFVSYLKFAGYSSPAHMPRFWKAIIMSAFPVLCEGGVGVEEGFLKDPLAYILKIQHWQSGFLKMMSHQDKITQDAVVHNCPMMRMIQG